MVVDMILLDLQETILENTETKVEEDDRRQGGLIVVQRP